MISVVDVEDIKNGSSSLPNTPGVYAWYRKIDLDDTTDADFSKSVYNILLQDWKNSLKSESVIGPYEATIELAHPTKKLTDRKEKILDDVKCELSHRAKFSYIARYASAFQEPIYIGKGDDLEDRIKRHVNGQTGFYKRIASSGFYPTDCIVAYVELKGLPDGANNLLEYLIDAITNPQYGEKSG